jgi:hypothetical protein
MRTAPARRRRRALRGCAAPAYPITRPGEKQHHRHQQQPETQLVAGRDAQLDGELVPGEPLPGECPRHEQPGGAARDEQGGRAAQAQRDDGEPEHEPAASATRAPRE